MDAINVFSTCLCRIDGIVMLIFVCIMPFQQVATSAKRLGDRQIHTLRVLKVYNGKDCGK